MRTRLLNIAWSNFSLVSASLLAVGFATSSAWALTATRPTGAYAQIIGGTAGTTFDQKAAPVGAFITKDGVLRTSPTGRTKVFIWDSETTISLAAGSEIQLNDPRHASAEAAQEGKLLKGVARWTTSKNKKPEKKLKLTVRSHNAAMGVRGTDFLTTYNALLDETEIVVFEGTVTFGESLEAADALNVTPNQWGGLGGRFGAKVHGPIDLPENVVSTFRDSLDVKTTVAGMESPASHAPPAASPANGSETSGGAH